MTDLERRAMSAYFKNLNALGATPMQPRPPTTVEHNGLTYVVLSNGGGVLAVYRVRIVNGKPVLKGLKRWPKEVEKC